MTNPLEYNPNVFSSQNVESEDALEINLECKGDVVYTQEMSTQPELRTCYAEYLTTKDKSKYYACVRNFIASKVKGMDVDGAQLIVRGLGLNDKRNMTIRVCQKNSATRPIDVMHHILMPFFVVGGVGVLILKNKCGRTMAPTELYLSAAALGFAGSIASIASNLLA